MSGYYYYKINKTCKAYTAPQVYIYIYIYNAPCAE